MWRWPKENSGRHQEERPLLAPQQRRQPQRGAGPREDLQQRPPVGQTAARDQPTGQRQELLHVRADEVRRPQVAAAESARSELPRLVRLMHGGVDDAGLAAMHWAQVHGLAVLLLEGPLGQQLPGQAQQRAFVREPAELFASRVLRPGG
jgi:hypothetical protein